MTDHQFQQSYISDHRRRKEAKRFLRMTAILLAFACLAMMGGFYAIGEVLR